MLILSLVVLAVSVSEIASLWDENKEGRLVMLMKSKEKDSPGFIEKNIKLSQIMNMLMYVYLATEAANFAYLPAFALFWIAYTFYMGFDSFQVNKRMQQVASNEEIHTYEVAIPFQSQIIIGLYYMLAIYVLIFPFITK